MATDLCAPWMTRWGLVADGDGFTTKFGSQLRPVRFGGAPAMLKIAVHIEEERGGALMQWWDSVGAAQVLAREGPALLLERLDGGRDLTAMARGGQDDEATAILCQVAAGLHAPRDRPAPDTLVPLDVWFRSLAPAAAAHGGTFDSALAAARSLLAEPRDLAVMHGDLHHGNVLDGGPRGWLAIDPKGVFGERGFDYANLFYNPWPTAADPGRLQRRLALVAEASGLEPARLLRWILAYGGLSAAWTLESGMPEDGPDRALQIAEMAAALA